MRTHVRFRSRLFDPLKPEEAQVNPGVYGEELAAWIHEHLGEHGLSAQDHFGEDWGWMVVFGRDFPAWIGCSNVDGETGQWLCFCEIHRGFLDRLLRRPLPVAARERTIRSLAALLASEPRITNVEWFSIHGRGGEYDHSPQPG